MDIKADATTVQKEDLREIYLFAELDEAQLERVVADVQPVQLARGESLFAQGQTAEHFYLVRSGQIKLYRLSAEGNEKVIEIIQPGQTFAEALIFMSQSRYPVHAEALEEASLLSFSNRVFKAVLSESVETCFRLMATMSMRLHQHVNEIERLTLHNATHRLVGYLLRQETTLCGQVEEVRLPASKHTIASRLSIQPETLSRILTRLADQGLIRVQGNAIQLLDVQALRYLVEMP